MMLNDFSQLQGAGDCRYFGSNTSFQTIEAGQVTSGGRRETVWNMANFTSAPYKEGSVLFWFGATSHDQGKSNEERKNEGPHVHVNPKGIPTNESHQYGTFKILLCYGPNRDQVKAISFGGVPQPVIDRTLKHVKANRKAFLKDWDALMPPINTEPTNDPQKEAEAVARYKAGKKEQKRQNKGYAIPDISGLPVE